MGLAPEYILVDQQKFHKAKLSLDNHVYKNCEMDNCDIYYSGGTIRIDRYPHHQFTTHPQPPCQEHLQRDSNLQNEIPRFPHRLRVTLISCASFYRSRN